ncbi:hypothetical protein NC653_036816 [Populus alba x Populus x berolinensis]|uniref:Uncharacterized protein n=1 Tax=Populus alba x Populus x berolinensis TaxID=444605 RepID=A0AAD6LL41_9ROSI|nr:hypothetical protein NC653_036816 [Populus alba x Populus x berolinensis]
MNCKIWISTIQMHVDSVLVTLSIFQPTGHGPHGCMMAFSPTRSSACFTICVETVFLCQIKD